MITTSIIIVGYNSLSDLERCLPSVLSTLEQDSEIIVVDNHSSDGTAEKLPIIFPQIKLIISESNLGFGGANNLGAQSAKGKYLVFLNPDTMVTSGWIISLLNPLINDQTIGMTTPKILQLNQPQKINTCGNDLHFSGLALCRGMDRELSNFSEPENLNSISGASFAISREYFYELGGFDPTFFLYVEDTDLSLRCLLNGKRILFVPDALVYHDYKLNFGPKKVYYQERNRYYMLNKTFKPITRYLISPILFLSEILSWGYCLLNGKHNIQNELDAYIWIHKHQEQTQLIFEKTQQLRKISDYQLIKDFSWRIDFSQIAPPFFAFILHCFFDPLFFFSSRISLWFISKES